MAVKLSAKPAPVVYTEGTAWRSVASCASPAVACRRCFGRSCAGKAGCLGVMLKLHLRFADHGVACFSSGGVRLQRGSPLRYPPWRVPPERFFSRSSRPSRPIYKVVHPSALGGWTCGDDFSGTGGGWHWGAMPKARSKLRLLTV